MKSGAKAELNVLVAGMCDAVRGFRLAAAKIGNSHVVAGQATCSYIRTGVL